MVLSQLLIVPFLGSVVNSLFFFFPVVVFCRGIFLQYEAEWGIWFCFMEVLISSVPHA